MVRQYTDSGSVPVNPHLLINGNHITLRGCWGIDFSHLYRAVAFASAREEQVRWKRLVSRVYSLDEQNGALGAVRLGRVVEALVAPNGEDFAKSLLP